MINLTKPKEKKNQEATLFLLERLGPHHMKHHITADAGFGSYDLATKLTTLAFTSLSIVV
jgi:hypothetical protein